KALVDDVGGASIWQAGQAPAIDDKGFIYVATGNGSFSPGLGNFGSSILKLELSLTKNRLSVVDYFTPANWRHLNYWDVDIGSAGPLLIPGWNLLVSGGKEGWLYTLNRLALGGLQRVEGDSGFRAVGH